MTNSQHGSKSRSILAQQTYYMIKYRFDLMLIISTVNTDNGPNSDNIYLFLHQYYKVGYDGWRHGIYIQMTRLTLSRFIEIRSVFSSTFVFFYNDASTECCRLQFFCSAFVQWKCVVANWIQIYRIQSEWTVQIIIRGRPSNSAQFSIQAGTLFLTFYLREQKKTNTSCALISIILLAHFIFNFIVPPLFNSMASLWIYFLHLQ